MTTAKKPKKKRGYVVTALSRSIPVSTSMPMFGGAEICSSISFEDEETAGVLWVYRRKRDAERYSKKVPGSAVLAIEWTEGPRIDDGT